jgi:hypothetical protein
MLFRSALLFQAVPRRALEHDVVTTFQSLNSRTVHKHMKNPIPSALDDLFALAEKAADGLHSLQTTLGIMHNTEALLRADLDAARSANSSYQAAKTTRLAATDAQNSADEDATAFILAARDSLKGTLGQRYSQAWNEVGFNASIAVPSTLDGRVSLVKAMELYFTAHAEQEVAARNITHDRAETLHAALSSAVSAVNAAWADQRNKKDARDEAAVALQNRLRKLSRELQQFLGDNDPRWLEFGFNVPADSELPEAPEDLIVAPSASGHLLARWSASPRALRYHVFKQVVGADQGFVYAVTVNDPTADMNTFTPGAHVKVRVAAVNEAGESQPSDAAEAVVA